MSPVLPDRKDSTLRHGRLLHPSSWAERDDRGHAAENFFQRSSPKQATPLPRQTLPQRQKSFYAKFPGMFEVIRSAGFTRATSICGNVALLGLVISIGGNSSAFAASDHIAATPPIVANQGATTLARAREDSFGLFGSECGGNGRWRCSRAKHRTRIRARRQLWKKSWLEPYNRNGQWLSTLQGASR